MLGIIYYIFLSGSVVLLGKIYHSQQFDNSSIVAGLMLCLTTIGFQASLLFIQRLIFLISFITFPFNIISSTSFKINLELGLEPLGGSLLVIGLLSLGFLRK